MKGHDKIAGAREGAGRQFEISVDGTPRTYRDRKAFTIEAAERLNASIRTTTLW